MKPVLADEFYEHAREFLRANHYIRHNWTREPEWAFLEIPAATRNSYHVQANVGPEGGNVIVDRSIVVRFDPLESYDTKEGVPSAVVAFLNELLSARMRLRIQYRGQRPTRWTLERETSEGWTQVASRRAILWSWLRCTSEQVYQNRKVVAAAP
jgi:hypothetical protein